MVETSSMFRREGIELLSLISGGVLIAQTFTLCAEKPGDSCDARFISL